MTPPSELEDLSPMCELVWTHLYYADGELLFADLHSRTARPEISIRKALSKLDEKGIIECRHDDQDLRKKRYTTSL